MASIRVVRRLRREASKVARRLRIRWQLGPERLPSRDLEALFHGIERVSVALPGEDLRRRPGTLPQPELLSLGALCRFLAPELVFEIGTFTGATPIPQGRPFDGAQSRAMMKAKRLVRRFIERAGYELRRSSPTVYEEPYSALLSHKAGVAFHFPTRFCVDKLGFSYGGWQPWVETVRQLMESPTRPFPYQQSMIKAFYETWSFPLLEHVFASGLTRDCVGNHFLKLFHGFLMPFSGRLKTDVYSTIRAFTQYLDLDNKQAGSELGIAESLRDDGTWSDSKGEIEMQRLSSLLESIRTLGYQRNHGSDGDIQGHLLKRNGDLRFVVDWGLHRASVLSALGHDHLTVRMHSSLIIDTDSIEKWPLVQQGVWPQEAAKAYFNHLFDFDSQAWVRQNAGLHQGLTMDGQ